MHDKKRGRKKCDWAKKVIEWTQSEEGKRQIEEADRNSLKAIDEFRKALLVDDEMLNSTFTL
jgi:hypothetical protein